MKWLCAALVLAPAMAFAQADRTASQQRVQELTFDPEKIDGTPLQAELERVDSRPDSTFTNLIQVRKDFRDKVREATLP